MEILKDDNEWYCNVCKEFKQASKQMSIYKAPKILIIHLKRFKSKTRHSSYSTAIQIKKKNNVFVQFPVKGLDLTNHLINKNLPFQDEDGPKPIYDLYGVSNHSGDINYGHYTAYCKNMINQNWYDFDDSSVHLIKDEEKVVTNSAYLLFYRRRDKD